MSDQPRIKIRYNGGLWSVTLTNGEYSEHIPDFRSKEDAQFYVDARFREWGYAPQPRHLHEYDADAEADCLAENKRLAERCEQLEAALRGMVDTTPLTANGHCFYCSEKQWFSQRHGHKPESHAPDCPVLLAKALLGEDGANPDNF